MNYKKKFYWATGIVVVLLSVMLIGGLTYYLRSRLRPGHQRVRIDSSEMSRTMERPYISVPNKSKQAEWDYRPTNNPRYEQNTNIQQIGFLTMEKNSPEEEPKILPLFGQSLRYKHSDRWTYFTATDQHQSIRIPVHYENRDCMNDDTGCRELSNQDVVKVPSYNDKNFTVSLYKKQLPHV